MEELLRLAALGLLTCVGIVHRPQEELISMKPYDFSEDLLGNLPIDSWMKVDPKAIQRGLQNGTGIVENDWVLGYAIAKPLVLAEMHIEVKHAEEFREKRQSSGVKFAPDCSWVTVGTARHDIPNRLQQAVLQVLRDKWNAGQQKVRYSEVLEAVGAKGLKLPNIFAGKGEVFSLLIGRDKKKNGFIWLNTPPA